MATIFGKTEAPASGDLIVASRQFNVSEAGAAVKAAGCEARLPHCGRLADLVVGEGEAPGLEVPRWRLHALCSACASSLGLTPREAA